ncbi:MULTISPECIES: N-acetylmuramic acid 6-phosphate etherase [Rhodomicrobium]|uniref:N-acetylmuramic acid 6-phosphate etherase n=1 Tax=Rhodomicrobium TaxID=1068 RepID=UPI000B4A8164|nr:MULTISPECIES: N-acetylmuramic acid 6-phosphate etherase [Rhodomicrobium]
MALTNTEQRHRASNALDTLPPEIALMVMCDVQIAAARAVRDAIPQIAEAAGIVAGCLESGGRLIYAGAGSSGLMALADALEIPGTFGIGRERIIILLSEGVETIANFAAETEDDEERGAEDVRALDPGANDCLIALSASGTTPYAVAALLAAKAAGAKTIAIANNAGTPLLTLAGTAIHLDTPPEILAGSTRMGAGTAQKIVLNMISTQAGIHLGHVHDGYMVNVRPDNAKLRDRARRMVSAIAGCDDRTAEDSFARSGGSTKIAILLASGADSPDAARAILQQSGQVLRPALQHLHASRSQNRNAPDGAPIGASR